jgi:hypothetical protein
MAAIPATPLFMRNVKLTLKVGVGAEGEYQCMVSTAAVVVTPGYTVTVQTLCSDGTFSSPGKSTYELQLEGPQDWTADGLSRYLWDNEGAIADVTLQPHGEAQAVGTETPAMTGQVTLAAGNFGGEVEAYASFAVTLPFVDRPALDIS